MNTTYIEGKRLTRTAKAAGIAYTEVAHWTTGRWPRRVVTGIEIATEDEAAMRAAITRRNKRRLTPAERLEVANARHARDAEKLAAAILHEFPQMPEDEAIACARHATEIGSGRVGRGTNVENPARAAVVAHVRHRHTAYGVLLAAGVDRAEARQLVRPAIDNIITKWSHASDK